MEADSATDESISEGKQATKSVENNPKPSKQSNKQEKEALVRKDYYFGEDQQTVDKDETKEKQKLHEFSEEVIIHDQGTEDSGTQLLNEEKVDIEDSITPSISESNKKMDSAFREKETKNSKEVSNHLKDRDQIQDKFHKDVVDSHVSKYDVQEALEANSEESFTENEAVARRENNGLGMLEDEKNSNIRAKVKEDSCNGSFIGLLKKTSEHEDTERDPETKKVENIDEGIEEKLNLVNIQDGKGNNMVYNIVVANFSKIGQQILESQKKIAGKNETVLEERLQEATEEIGQDLSVMKQKNENKKTTESGPLIVNMDEECEECVAPEEYIAKPSETRNKQEKEGNFLKEDQQSKKKDERKLEQNLIPVNEISEEAITNDQETEDSGKGFETKAGEEEKADTDGSVTTSITELNKETYSTIGEEETEKCEKVSNFLKDKNQIQDEFHKVAIDIHSSKYDVQEVLETNAEESSTGNKAVRGTENNDVGMLEDEEDANKSAVVHDDSCNGSSHDQLNKTSEHKVIERDPKQKKVENVDEAIKQEKLDLVNSQDGMESNRVDNLDVVPNIARISQHFMETQKKIVGKDKMTLKERVQEATKEIDEHISVMKQKIEDKETTETGQSTVNIEEEYEECEASEEWFPKQSEPSNTQVQEAVEMKGSFLKQVQLTREKDEIREEQYIIPVNVVYVETIIHDLERTESNEGLETKVQAEEKVDKASTITPISEKDEETESPNREKHTENSETLSNFTKNKDKIKDEFRRDVFDAHVAKCDEKESIETDAEKSFTGNEATEVIENIELGMLEDEEDANKRSIVHDDSRKGSSNGQLTKASERKVKDPELKKVENVNEAIKQEKLDLVNIQDGRESNQVDNFDVVPNIAKISQHISESQKKIADKDEMTLKERLQEETTEIDHEISVMKQKNEDKETTESRQLNVNMEEEYEECVASEVCIPKPSEPSNKQEKDAVEKKGGFLQEVQQTKEKDETRAEQYIIPVNEVYIIPVNEVSEEAIIHDPEKADSNKGLQTKVSAEEKADKVSTITLSILEKNEETESRNREKEIKNSEKVSDFLKNKDQIQDEFHQDVLDTHVAKYDEEDSIETNAEKSLTGKETANGTEHIDLGMLEDEEDANKRSNVHDDSCNSLSNDLLNGASEHEDKERVPEPKKEDIIDETIKQKKLYLGTIQDGRESNQVDDLYVLADIPEISQQILDHQKEITGRDGKVLDMKEIEDVNKYNDTQLYVIKPKYGASSNELGKKETESSQLIVYVGNKLEESSQLASDENISKPLKPKNTIKKEAQEKNENFFNEAQLIKDREKTKEEQNATQANQVSKEKTVPDQERSDSRKDLQTDVQEDVAEAKQSNIPESDKEIDSAIQSKELDNFQEVPKVFKDKEHSQDDLDKDVADKNVTKSDVQEALETDADVSTMVKEAATMVNNNLSDGSDLPERPLLQHENKCQHQTQTGTWAEGMEQAKEEQSEAVLHEEKASEITYSIEHDERGCLEDKASPQANSEGKLTETVLEKSYHDVTEGLQIELRNDNFYIDTSVKQYANGNMEENRLKDKDKILLNARAEWKSNNITEPIHSYDTTYRILPEEEIEKMDAEKDFQNEDTSYKQPHTRLTEKIEDKEAPCSCMEEEKMEQVQEKAEEIREKNLTVSALENELQQKREGLNVSLQANQIHQMELKKQINNRSEKSGTDDVGIKTEPSIMAENSGTAATKEEKKSMPLQGNQNHTAIKLSETTRHGIPTRKVFPPNKPAAKNDGAVTTNKDDDPQEVTAHIKETTHTNGKRDGAAAESSMQSQGRQQHQKMQVYESITEGKIECFELEEMPIKSQALRTMKDMLDDKVKQQPQQSIKEQEIDKESQKRVLRIQNAVHEAGKNMENYNEIKSELVEQDNDKHCPCTKLVIDQTTCMTDKEVHKEEVTYDISNQIKKNIVPDEHISETAVSCLEEDERTYEELQDDDNNNKKPEQILTEEEQEFKASDATERRPSDDKIKDSMSPSSVENFAVTSLSGKTNPEDEENTSKNHGLHQVLAYLEETTQQEGDVLSVSKTNVKKKFVIGIVDEDHFKEGELDCKTVSSEIKDVENAYAHDINEMDKFTLIEASKSQFSNETLMTDTKFQEGNKRKTDETGLACKDGADKTYTSAEIGKHEKSSQNVSVISQEVAASPSEEMDIMQPIKDVHNKIKEVGNFDDERYEPGHNDFPVSQVLLDHVLREDKLHKSYVMELENKPKENNELDKNGVTIKEQVTTARLPSEQTSEKKCTSDEAEAQNFEQSTDIKQEEKNNGEQKRTANTFPSFEHASTERDTSEEAATEHQKLEQTTNSMQDEKNNDVKEDKLNMIISKYTTQDSNIYDSSVVIEASVVGDNVFFCNNPFSGVSSTSLLTTTEQGQIFIDGLVVTDLVQGEKDNEVNLEKQTKESRVHDVKESPPGSIRILSNVIVDVDNNSYEEDRNEKEVLQNAGYFNKSSDANPQESSPLISELNQKEKKLVQREEYFPTCQSTEDSVLQETKLHGIMNVDFKIKGIESVELNPMQVSHSEVQDVNNVPSKEGAKSMLAQVEENETDTEKGEKEEKEDGADRPVQVAEKFVEGCTSVSKGEKGKVETTIDQVGGDNSDEERDGKEVEESHIDEEPGHEASRNMDSRVVVKPTHKKSHNILSSVGSKVKHSIAKVRKVITCKSPHSKTSTPK